MATLAVADQSFRVFYRIVETSPPTIIDFMSYEALGRVPRRPNPGVMRRWSGISVFETEEQARSLAQWRPSLGQYIAALRVEIDSPIRWERTGDAASGHHTIWGDPDDLFARIISIVHV